MDKSLLNDELLLILKGGRQNEITFLNAQIANIPCPRVIVTELTARDCLEAARPPNWTKVRLEQEIVKIMSETGAAQPLFKAQYNHDVKNKGKPAYVTFYEILKEHIDSICE